MLRTRVIPCLLLDDGRLVKTRKFKKPTYVGDPINTVKIFNVKEVDEIIILDIGASKRSKAPNFELVGEIASECFMPMCYGGGIFSIDDATRIFESGVEKISIQSGAISNLKLIETIAHKYGSSSVVVSIDVKKRWSGRHAMFASATGKKLSSNWEEFAMSAVNAGAGELLINSVDNDGELNGLDTSLVSKISNQVSVPVIACGGVSSLDDMLAGAKAGASAIGAGAFFVFQGPLRAVLISYPKYEDLEQLFGSLDK